MSEARTTFLHRNEAIGARAHLPAVDGIRALSLIAVLLFHAAPGLLSGGFIGVEVFFVVSGFVITRSIVKEWQLRRSVGLRSFWLRRALRLLPALAVLIVSVVAYVSMIDPDALASLRTEMFASLAYVMNWHLVLSGDSYLASFSDPSPLTHLWSLAVEEQFYVVWPLLLSMGLTLRKPRLLLVLTIAGALASVLLMAGLYMGGANDGRLYYGTDTRASGLLFGAALALAGQAGVAIRRPDAGFFLEVAGIAGLALIVAGSVLVANDSPLLYLGGFAVVDAAAVLLLLSAAQMQSATARFLSFKPLQWLGLRSYGIYLWHWPILLLAWPEETGVVAVILKLLAAVTAAALSYVLVEQPIRCWGRATSVSSATSTVHPIRRWRLRIVVLAACAALLTGAAGIAAVPTSDGAPQLASSVRIFGSEPTPATPSGESEEWSGEDAPADQRSEPLQTPMPTSSPSAPASPATKPVAAIRPAAATGPRVTAIGDSVLLSAATELAALVPGIDIDASLGRQTWEAIEILEQRRHDSELAQVVLLHIGNNGPLTAAQIDKIMAIAGKDRRVVFVNVKVERPWQSETNVALADGAQRFANLELVDWYGASNQRKDLFWKDDTHLNPEGISLYADLVSEVVKPSH
ncbi:MAG: acyltransferase family protein [Dehalococcoidia bacterium]|nr:acyltransferase family protein [Dehalococcoidia bacterium]